MIRKKQGKIEWLEFELLAEHLVHGVFLRHGGVSEGAFASLNAGGGTTDHPEDVLENRRRMFHILGASDVVEGKQVHGDILTQVNDKKQGIGDCDALLTDVEGVGLLIKHADCQAALIYDPKHHVFANVHCGWRGNVKNIYRKTIEKMRELFSSRPQDLLVGIAPSLGPEHAEFVHYRSEFPEDFWNFQVRPNYFDLWEISRYQLLESGVLSQRIEIAKICSFSNPDDCFSYRRDKITGRNATIALL